MHTNTVTLHLAIRPMFHKLLRLALTATAMPSCDRRTHVYSNHCTATGLQATRVDYLPHITNLLIAVDRAAKEAGSRIAPAGPRSGPVAINPPLSAARECLPANAQTVVRMPGARLTITRACHAALPKAGRIGGEYVADLSDKPGVATSEDRSRGEALQPEVSVEGFELPTVATLAARRTEFDWIHLITGSISNWATGYFAEGRTVWSAAPADASPWASFQAVAGIDRSPELMGLKHARRSFAELPAQPVDVLAMLATRLRLPEQGLTPYFNRLIDDVAGWVGYASYLGWRAEVRGEEGSAARQLLAIRAAWELVLLESFRGSDLESDVAAFRQHYLEIDSELGCASAI